MFDDHMKKMDSLVLKHLGSSVVFLHGSESWPVTVVPNGGEDSSRINRSHRRVRGSTKTLETVGADLPPGIPVDQLKVIESGITYQVIDHDIDVPWVVLYLAPAGNIQSDKSDEKAFLF